MAPAYPGPLPALQGLILYLLIGLLKYTLPGVTDVIDDPCRAAIGEAVRLPVRDVMAQINT